MSTHGNAKHGNPLRKLGEDARLRPFLSSMFDPQIYTRTVIKDGRSEETFGNIVECIEDVNVEIKGYISQHKDDLMSGMQEVSTLADRYNSLSSSSQKLRKNIQRLKKESLESYRVVNAKTQELARIHETSIILQQLQQFVQAKAHLDSYLHNSEEKDIRNLSSVARTLSDLERLLENPKLLKIKLVADSAANIKLFGQNIRLLAQDRLLASIADKNQAAIASCLQVFYNLDSLPEITLMAIDSVVKQTVEFSRYAWKFEQVLHYNKTRDTGPLDRSSYSSGSGSSGSSNSGSATKLAASLGAASTSLSGQAASQSANSAVAIASLYISPLVFGPTNGSSGAGSVSVSSAHIGDASLSNASSSIVHSNNNISSSSAVSQQMLSLTQLRLAIREVVHCWAEGLQDKATQVHVLQRVLLKKEDPATHERFLDVLRSRATATTAFTATTGRGGGSGGSVISSSSSSSLPEYLTTGNLVELFWSRLSNALFDVAAEKVRGTNHLPAAGGSGGGLLGSVSGSTVGGGGAGAGSGAGQSNAVAHAAGRCYPQLRKLSMEVMDQLFAMTMKEGMAAAVGMLGRRDILGLGVGANGYLSAQRAGIRGSVSAGRGGAISPSSVAFGPEMDFAISAGMISALGIPPPSSSGRGVGDSLFGSMQWAQQDLLGSMGIVPSSHQRPQHNGSSGVSASITASYSRKGGPWGGFSSSLSRSGFRGSATRGVHSGRQKTLSLQDQARHPAGQGGGGEGGIQSDFLAGSADEDKELGFLAGLKPIRDFYLINAFARMTGPIKQMFPELEGYTAAIPSKRDLQTLTRSIQSEYVTAVVEGDASLLRILNKEVLKTIRMMLTKIEGIVINSPETRKISSHTNFARTSQQEHNAQLVLLLMQFKDALEKIPGSAMRAIIDSRGSGSGGGGRNGAGGGGRADVRENTPGLTRGSLLGTAAAAGGRSLGVGSGSEANVLSKEEEHSVYLISQMVRTAVRDIEELAQRQILDPIIALLSGYTRSVLTSMHKEGVVSLFTPVSTNTGGSSGGGSSGAADPTSPLFEESSLESSTAVQMLVKQMPVFLRVHLQSLVTSQYNNTPSSSASSSSSSSLLYPYSGSTSSSHVTDVGGSRIDGVPATPGNTSSVVGGMGGTAGAGGVGGKSASPVTRLVHRSVEEVLLRTLHAYVSIAALVRPVSEHTRLRTAKDMGALEMLVSSVAPAVFANSACPVVQEFRSFRRVLFEESATPTTPASSSSSNIALPPKSEALRKLFYAQQIRPSTLLGYLISCGPAQLPSPYDLGDSSNDKNNNSNNKSGGYSPAASFQQYVDALSEVVEGVTVSDDAALHSRIGLSYAPPASCASSSLSTLSVGVSHSAAAEGTAVGVRGGWGGGVRSLYKSISNPAAVGGGGGGSWRVIETEKRCWALIQQCLDTYFQRISVVASSSDSTHSNHAASKRAAVLGAVAEDEMKNQKQVMRAWYELILDVGSLYFGASPTATASVI